MARTRWSAVLAGTVAVAASCLAPAAHAQSRVFEHLSRGDINGNLPGGSHWKGTSPDGLRVFFSTEEPLVLADGDQVEDVYERGPAGLALLTGDSDPAVDATFGGLSADATSLFFWTPESLAGGDAGQRNDVYETSGGEFTLLSPGSANNDWFFAGNTPDGSVAFMHSTHNFEGGDTAGVDVFRRDSSGTIDYVSEQMVADGAAFLGTAADASRAFFHVMGATTEAFRSRPAGGLVETVSGDIPNDLLLEWNGNSADGTRAFFTTNENLLPGDLGGANDVYERHFDGSPDFRLISSGDLNPASFGAISPDGDRVLFTTAARMLPADMDPDGPQPGMFDSYKDVYERRADDSLRLVSGGNGPHDARFVGATPDAMRVFFDTHESLLAGDADTTRDVYERDAGGALRLVSGGTANAQAFYVGVSGDGSHVFFSTAEALVPEDVDGMFDVYARRADGAAILVTSGTDEGLMNFHGSSADGTRVILSTTARLAPTDTDNEIDVYASRPADPAPPGGNGPGNGPGNGTTPDANAPFITSLLMPRAIRPRLGGGSVAQRRRRGGVVRYSISEAATTRFRVDRAAPGRRVGRRCRKPTRRNRTRRRCTRWVARGGFTHRAVAGPNRFVFTGRVRGRRLRVGRHRLVARATDAAGNRSLPRARRFRVIR